MVPDTSLLDDPDVPNMYVEVQEENRRVYLMSSNGKVLTFSQRYATLWNAKRAANNMFGKTLPKYVLYSDNRRIEFE